MIDAHLPVLLLVLPLMAAPICVLLHNARLGWLLALTVCLVLFAGSWSLLFTVLEQGTQRYLFGNWEVPWGIELYVDSLNSFVLVIVTTIAAAAIIYAKDSVEKEIANDRTYLFYSAFLLNMTGLFGVILTGDAFNLFVFIEISSLSGYALISLGSSRQALYASFRYLILGTIGATFILIGVGLLYAVTGSLNMQDISDRLANAGHDRTVTTAVCFLFIGMMLKLALFPLHVWLPAAYTTAPSVVGVFMAGTTTKVFVYVFIRYMFDIFGLDLLQARLPVDLLLQLLSAAAVIYGSWMAINQQSIKLILAWSSVAQIGYMILGISMLTATGVTASILHLFNHALMKTALFMAAGCLVYKLGTDSLAKMQTDKNCMPFTRIAFILGGLSLIGVPGTVGFLSKWYLLSAAFQANLWLLLLVIVIGSLLAVIYVWKIVEAFYFRQPAGQASAQVTEAPIYMLVPLWLLVIANYWFGIETSLTVDTVNSITNGLMAANQ